MTLIYLTTLWFISVPAYFVGFIYQSIVIGFFSGRDRAVDLVKIAVDDLEKREGRK